MIKCEQLNILNLKLTSNGKLIDKQDYNKKSWDVFYETLCKAVNNGVKIAQTTVYEGINIGMWVNRQRKNFKDGKLSEGRIQKLKDIGLKLEVLRTWDENYETLCRAINNDVKITSRTVYEGINIGIWLGTQRQLFKNGELPEDKAKKLQDIGLGLDPRKESWDENYETLCKAMNNGVKITQTTAYEGVNIGHWLNAQRQFFKKGKLSEDKVQKLQDIGLEFEIRKKLSWDENYETLCRAMNNGVKITQATVYEGINIGIWLNHQRQLFKNGKLTEDKVQKLKDIGLGLRLDTREALSWDEKYEILCKVIEAGVGITSTTVYEGVNIGIWINKQRQLFKNGNLPEDKIQKLKDAGLELDPRKTSWDENYEILCSAINNGVKVTQTTVYEDVNIGVWIGTQRQLFKKGKLSEDRVQKLRNIGLRLNMKETLSWDEKYEILCRAINNGVRIIKNTVYEGINIGAWINTQRYLFKNGELPEDKIQKLKETGLELGEIHRSWDENYETLCRAINNGVEITYGTVYEDINIGHWLNNQRYLLKNGKLSEDKIQKLKDIGIELDPRKTSWDENYEVLCRAINNGVEINSKTVYEDINIGYWLYNQHQLLKSGKLPEDKIQKLKDIDLEFDTRKIVPWDESYEALCRAIDNKVKINQRTVYEDINIGKWINNQRQLFKNGKLTEDRIEKLRKIGVII